MPSETKWKMGAARADDGGISIEHADGPLEGRLIAIVYEDPYAPQIASTPELYEMLEALTNTRGVKALHTRVDALLAKCRGESPDAK